MLPSEFLLIRTDRPQVSRGDDCFPQAATPRRDSRLFSLSTGRILVDFARGFCHTPGVTVFTYMKLNRLLVLSLVFSLGFAFAEGADAPDYSHVHWAQGVGVNAETGEVEGWYDAEKNDREGDADDNMCYAASASNIIAWWQDNYSAMASPGAPKALNGAAGIWDSFVQSNQDVEAGGDPLSAINWWLTGVYEPADSEGALLPKAETDVWNRYYLPYDEVAEAAEGNDEYFSGALSNFEMAGKPFNGYYYDEYGLTQQDMADFLVTAWEGDDATESGTTHSTLTMGDINVDADGDTESIYDIPFATILD